MFFKIMAIPLTVLGVSAITSTATTGVATAPPDLGLAGAYSDPGVDVAAPTGFGTAYSDSEIDVAVATASPDLEVAVAALSGSPRFSIKIDSTKVAKSQGFTTLTSSSSSPASPTLTNGDNDTSPAEWTQWTLWCDGEWTAARCEAYYATFYCNSAGYLITVAPPNSHCSRLDCGCFANALCLHGCY